MSWQPSGRCFVRPFPAAGGVYVGGYLSVFDASPTLAGANPIFNLIYCAFADGDYPGGYTSGPTTGHITFSPNQSSASFIADLATCHLRGQKVLLSIGGATDTGIRLLTSANVSEMLESIATIKAGYDFDGVDLDLENDQVTWTIANVQALASQLKATYGPGFIISLAPQPAVLSWKTCAAGMGDNLDIFTMQFYDYAATDPERISGINSRIAEMVTTYGVPIGKLGIGCRCTEPANPTFVSAPAVYRAAFDANPGIGAVNIWTLALDLSTEYGFAAEFADLR